ncbi:MAG TPA: CHASE2 domain-containing protein, partial [Usitatibacter sp.]|nr:CHASE2 domain-containing protein [Usitatibacter sp.]
MKTAFWKADWFFGLVIVAAVFIFNQVSGVIPGLERWAYDLGVKTTSKTPSDKVAIIAIDDQSIANIGRWPWPREVQAKLTDQLVAAKAKVIGNTTFFFEPQKDPGLQYVEKMLDVYNKAYPPASAEVPGVAPIGGQTPAALGAQPPAEVAEIGKILHEASASLNNDVRLAASMKSAGNVLVPMQFDASYGAPQGKPDKPLPEYVARNAIGGASGDGNSLHGLAVQYPIEQIGATVAGMGHLTGVLDADGATRYEPL